MYIVRGRLGAFVSRPLVDTRTAELAIAVATACHLRQVEADGAGSWQFEVVDEENDSIVFSTLAEEAS